jgi:hypothetical protein
VPPEVEKTGGWGAVTNYTENSLNMTPFTGQDGNPLFASPGYFGYLVSEPMSLPFIGKRPHLFHQNNVTTLAQSLWSCFFLGGAREE